MKKPAEIVRFQATDKDETSVLCAEILTIIANDFIIEEATNCALESAKAKLTPETRKFWNELKKRINLACGGDIDD